jgi:hypothetical protein
MNPKVIQSPSPSPSPFNFFPNMSHDTTDCRSGSVILPKKSPRSEPADRCPRLRLSSANGISSQHLEKEEFGRQAQAVDQS